MTHVRRIEVHIVTGNESGADADGPVYLGVGNREFRLARKGVNSFEKGKPDDFIMDGAVPANSNVNNPDENNPMEPIRIEGPVVTSTNYSVYIRYESNTKWLVEQVKVTISGVGFTTTNFGLHHELPAPAVGITSPGIWLGSDYGKFLYLDQIP